MKPLFSLLIASLFTWLQSSAQVNTPNQQTITKGKTYAVVIGISDYGNGGIPHLKYADRDASAFAEYLSSPAGGQVPRDQIRLLLNEDASLLNVDQALKWLVQKCNAGDLAYFYFSGHGDVENSTIYPAGFLLCYNAPVNNYNISSLEVRRLNDFANTISRATGGQVIMITDACHSGTLVGSENKGQSLVGAELLKVQDRETRITSCSSEEKSWESDDLGGGRGLFSFNLVNGMKGWADKQKDGKITVSELREFIRTALSFDPVLEFNNATQTPVVQGRDDYILATPDSATLVLSNQQMADRVVTSARLAPGPKEITDPSALKTIFFETCRSAGIGKLMQGEDVASMTPAVFEKKLFEKLKEKITNQIERENMQRYADYLHDADNESDHQYFISNLASELDNLGESAINLYLKGDEATLQNRINDAGAGMELYPAFFAMARKMVGVENPAMNSILEVKQYYFSGLLARLKSYTSTKAAALQTEALNWQQKALTLEKFGAYIYNELGILYQLKKNMAAAESSFRKATELTPLWQIPWANLSILYAITGRLDEGIKAVDSAIARNPGSSVNFVNKAFLFEKKKDLLSAEEFYQEALRINPEYFFPYERLGQLMISKGEFMRADSFFTASEYRRKGIMEDFSKHPVSAMFTPDPPIENLIRADCKLTGTDSLDHTVRLVTAIYAAESNPEKATAIFKDMLRENPNDVLAWHFLGEFYYNNNNLDAAESILLKAESLYPAFGSIDLYKDSLNTYAKTDGIRCYIKNFIKFQKFSAFDNKLMLARLYAKWNQPEKMEKAYRQCMELDPKSEMALTELCDQFSLSGRYREEEDLLKNLYRMNRSAGRSRLGRFYSEINEKYPGNEEWQFAYAGFLYNELITHPENYPLQFKIVNNIGDVEAMENSLNRPLSVGEFRIVSPRSNVIRLYSNWLANFALDPGISSVVANRIGNIFLQMRQTDSAGYYFNLANTLIAGNAGVIYKLAGTQAAASKFTAAYNGLESLFRAGQLNFEGQLVLAAYRMRKGNTTGCDSLLDHITSFSISPDEKINLLRAANAAAAGQYGKAIDLLKKIPGVNSDAYLLYQIARYSALNKQTEPALQYLAKVKSIHTWWKQVLEKDPAWDNMRTNPGFKKWMSDDD